MRAVIAVADGVTEEENAEEFRDQYREQKLLEGFENGKFNPILWLHISTKFYKHILLACFIKLHMFLLLKTWLDSHPLICYNHSLTT